MLKENSMIELSKIMASNENGIARLNLRENMLRDNGMRILAQAISKNQSIVHLDICQSMLTPKGFKKLFKAMLKNESITSIDIGNPGNTNRNRIGDKGTKALVELLTNNLLLQFLDMRGLTMGDQCCATLA